MTAPAPTLCVVMHETHIADLFADSADRIALRYRDAWRESPNAIPLSLSMPISIAAHESKTVRAFLWGLLPDNRDTLKQYGATFGVSPRNPVALLSHMGEDCAGALQFVTPERLGEFTGAPSRALQLERIDAAEVAADLRRVRRTGVAALDRRSPGRFSLAGAQPKLALYRDSTGWARAMGRTPTTHILKPPSAAFDGFAENEHYCLALAGALGMRAVTSSVERFEDQVAIVVERYDRRWEDGVAQRVHQEDCCQALGIHPDLKYESDGGPGARAIGELLLESSGDPHTDVRRLLDALIFNWVIAATDGHAKNFSLLHAAHRNVRLAPLYDIASYLPYDDGGLHRLKLAMRVGREYRLRKVTRQDWLVVAGSLRIPKDEALQRLRALVERVPDIAGDVAQRCVAAGLDAAFIESLREKILTNAQRSLRAIDAGTQPEEGL